MASKTCFLTLDPDLEEQLDDIDEYIRAQNGEHVHTELSTDRNVPDGTSTSDLEDIENYPDDLTLHGESRIPPGLDFKVHFHNLKDIYEKRTRKTANGFGYKLGDSTVTIEATASSGLQNLKVYVQRCPEAAIKTHDTVGPMELEVTIKQHEPNKTTVTVVLDSIYKTDRGDVVYWLEKAEVETRNKWELLIVPVFMNGVKGVVKSKPFRITTKASYKSARKESGPGLIGMYPGVQQIDGFDGKERIHPSTTSVEDFHLDYSSETSMENSCAENTASNLQHELARLQMDRGPASPLNPPWNQSPAFPESMCVGGLILRPDTSLDREMITSRYNHDSRIRHAMEQSDLPGLMKMVSRKFVPIGGRRRANGHKSAEENFWWACGFCFFERRKKSTVKAHVMQRVCRKSAEQKEHKRCSSTGRMKRYPSCDTLFCEPSDAFSWQSSLSV